jgi:hypothetical protein
VRDVLLERLAAAGFDPADDPVDDPADATVDGA